MKRLADIRAEGRGAGSARAEACGENPRRGKHGEKGFAYLMALMLITVVLIGSTAVIERYTVREQREREREMIWRGNQYARAIRMYYRKVGRYPTSVDDLMQGQPGIHFLRQAYKDPMNKEDGTWRLIYLNPAGQIIGSSRYASLQQMAVIDSLGLQPGQLPPALTGQPGVSVAALASGAGEASGSTTPTIAGGLTPAVPYKVLSADNPTDAAIAYQAYQAQQAEQNASAPPPTDNSGQPSAQSSLAQQLPPDAAQALQQAGVDPSTLTSSQIASALAQGNSTSAFSSDSGSSAFSNGSGSSAFSSGPSQQGSSAFGAPSNNALGTTGVNTGNPLGQAPNALAGLNAGILTQKPTGPVDGPVVGAFLTGVGSKVDKHSIIWPHGAKKYSDWEFIWNPLEDQAAAIQQGLNQVTNPTGQGGLPVANPFGGSTGTNPNQNPNQNPNPQPAPTPPPVDQ